MSEKQKAPQEQVFINARDFNKENVEMLLSQDLLKRMNVKIIRQVSKSGFVRHYIYFIVHPDYLDPSIKLDKTQWADILLSLDIEPKDEKGNLKSEIIKTVYYRYITGDSDYGQYKAIEIIFGPGLYFRHFFNDKDDKKERSNIDKLEMRGKFHETFQLQPGKMSSAEINLQEIEFDE